MAPPRKKRLVRADQLSWKAVSLPARLDDAEGFYGLEEIDDVEVIRDEKSRKITFKAAVPAGDGVSDAEVEGEGEDDFEGFGDDDGEVGEHGGNESSSKASGKQSLNGEKVKAKKERKEREEGKAKKKKAEKGVKANGNAFENLDGELEDQDAEVDVSEWQGLGLSADSLTALSRMKFGKPTKIQVSSIPEIVAGHDVVGKASTGSGKTLAYGLPILDHVLAKAPLREKATKTPAALILAPTRELAHQISKHLAEFSSKLPSASPRFATITGGLSVHKQQRMLKDADVVIGTPGRLWEVINSESGLLAALRQIQFLVVDEADRLLSEGHFKEVEEILNSLDRTDIEEGDVESTELQRPERQTLVFSATFQKDLQRKLAGKGKQSDTSIMSKKESLEYLLDKLNFREDPPKFIDVNPVSQMAENLREGLVECAANEKDLYLYALLLLHYAKTRTLVFTNSISAVRRLAPFLQNLNLPAQALHSQMPQKARLRAIERFSSADGGILVATDVAARGLDIPLVKLVVHYNVPRQADVYVHRSGRTARAENAGASVMLCSPDEVVPVRRLVVKVHAQNAAKKKSKTEDDPAMASKKLFLRTLDLDRQLVARLKRRADLAKKIADAGLAREKHRSEDNWLRKAAEELGVDYDSEEFAEQERGGRNGKGGGKGRQRREKEEEMRGLTREEMGRMKGELKGLLAQRVNVGVSERYLSAGGIDVERLLEREGEKGGEEAWLGRVDELDFD